MLKNLFILSAAGGSQVLSSEAVKNAEGSQTAQQLTGLLAMVVSGAITHKALDIFTPEGKVVGHDALKGPIGETLKKDPEAVTPGDIDGTIHKTFNDKMPAAADFNNVAAVITPDAKTATPPDKVAETLRTVYAETGVTPERLYKDARNNPQIAADVADGKIPEAYKYLIELKGEEKLDQEPYTKAAPETETALAETPEAPVENAEHKEAVRQALAEGKDVPPEVLAQYPDLVKAPEEKQIAEEAKQTADVHEEDARSTPPEKAAEVNETVQKEVNETISKNKEIADAVSQAIPAIAGDIKQSGAAAEPVAGENVAAEKPAAVRKSRSRSGAKSGTAPAGDNGAANAGTERGGTGSGEQPAVRDLTPEHKALEENLGTPENMTLPQLGRLDSKIAKIFANADQRDLPKAKDLSDAEFTALEDYGKRVEAARDALIEKNKGQIGAIDTGKAKTTEQPKKEAWQMTREEFERSQLSPESESVSKNPFVQIFNPANISDAAKAMATVLRENMGLSARETAIVRSSLKGFGKLFRGMSEAEQLKFIDQFEQRDKGVEISDPKLKEAADTIGKIYKDYADKIQQVFPDVKMRESYFTHQYEDEAAAKKFFSDWVAKQGSERNLKQRAFPTLKEAMDAGLKPRTTNPIETVLRYALNMSNLLAAHKGVEMARDMGIAEYFPKDKQPDGWVPLDGNLSEVNGQTLFAPEDAARVYNNSVSEGLKGPVGDIMNAWKRANNYNNMMQLGISLYHASLVTASSAVSDVSRAVFGGSLTDRAKDLGSAFTAPITDVIKGEQWRKEYLGEKEITDPVRKQALDALTRANAINLTIPDYLKSTSAMNFIDAFKEGHTLSAELSDAKEKVKEAPLTGTVKVIAGTVGRLMDTLSHPLFNEYIPRLKINTVGEEMYDWIQKHPESTIDEQNKQAQKIGDSVDNRYGEMIKDNLFWHKITQQVLQSMFLSFSWITGFARMMKGVPDIGRTIFKGEELTPDAKYLVGMAITYAAMNGVRTYMGTGQAPNNWKDFVYPRTGGVTPEGKAERELLPSHIGQFTGYLTHGIYELGNEASPLLKLLMHTVSNSDFRGLPITNANNPWFSEQRWGDYAKYVLGEETPIGN